MGLLDALFGSKTRLPAGLQQLPCILCGKRLDIRRGSRTNTYYYAMGGKHYALCARGCDGKGRPDDHKLWSRIAAISESQRAKSEVGDIS